MRDLELRGCVGTLVLLLAFCPVCLSVEAADRAPALFKDGERVCFIGDSITHGNDDESDYHEFIYLYYLTRFPDRKITMFDRGISGDTSWGTVLRFDEDIAPCKATVSTIMLGMNDVNRGLYGSSPTCTPAIQAKRDARLKQYREHMAKLCKQVTEAGSRLVLFTPSTFDQTSSTPGGDSTRPGARQRVNDGLVVFGDACRKLAAEFNAPVVNMNTEMLRIAAERQETDPFFSLQPGDRIHPDVNGAFVMAYVFLKAQNAPAVVSTLVLDAAQKRAVQQERCEVSELAITEDAASFVLTAEALPFPTDEVGAFGLRIVPFMDELNRETLCVKGLKPGAYALKIGGNLVGNYDDAALAAGINLAENSRTPQYRQAAKVAEMNMRRDNLSCKLRGLALIDFKSLARFQGDKADKAQLRAFFDESLAGMEGKAWHPYFKTKFDMYMTAKPQEASIAAEMTKLEGELREINQPRPHRYELARIGDALPLPAAEAVREPAGLTFHLPFDKSVSATTSQPACTAIEPAEVSYETGPVGDAVVIANNAGLRYKEPESFPLNASTIAFWIKPHWDPNDTEVVPYIFRKDRDGLVKYRHLYFNDQSIRFVSHQQPENKVKLVYSSLAAPGEDGKAKTGGSSQARWVVNDWSSNEWRHVCVTVGNVGRQRGNRMYVQGELVCVWAWDSPPEAHAKAFTLGGQWDERVPAKTMSIDDFRAYNRVLTSKEVYELYRRGARRAELLSRTAK